MSDISLRLSEGINMKKKKSETIGNGPMLAKRIYKSVFISAIIVFAASFILTMIVLYGHFSDMQMKELQTQAEFVAAGVEANGMDYINSLEQSDDYRITWIEADGTVVYDSMADTASMENHLEREEIQQALKTGEGISYRQSATLLERQLYCARLLSDGTIIRVSTSQYTWWTLIFKMIVPIVIVIIIAVVISLILGFNLSKKIVEPLNKLDLKDPQPSDTYEELLPLVEHISMQQHQLQAQSAELSRKKEEFEAASKHMIEGVILLDPNNSILSINSAATKLLCISKYCTGKDLLFFNNSPELEELLNHAKSGRHSEKSIAIGNQTYLFNASPVLSEGKVDGIALLILDVTEKERAEKLRREFTANVSHELKTPLQTISGCSELLSSGMVKEEDVPKFAKQIYSESKRMITLIEDIIGLSHLDEGASDMAYEPVDVYAVAEDTVESLESVAKDADVTIKLNELVGSNAVITGIRQLIKGVVYNLCENAIKYNRKGGSVTVTITEEKENVKLSVADTGIGIPLDQQDRIFERFYRVDKSHSKEVGGTGLGLSIVKHAAMLHNADITVKSIPDQGTEMTVIFPKEHEAE